MDNRSKLAVAGMVTHSVGEAELRASLKTFKKIVHKNNRRITSSSR